MWVEILFNISYLAVVWFLVAVMIGGRERVAHSDRSVAARAMEAFMLLAIGDTAHVGLRVLAHALGGPDKTITWLGTTMRLTGLGDVATSITVTLFYVLMLTIWRLRFGKAYGWFGSLLMVTAGVRLFMLALPFNEWGGAIAPLPWSVYRNIPLVLQGLGVAFLILRDAAANGDRAFRWIGFMILVSYACYAPVILFVAQVPLLGMLMIPKTLAYVAVGFIAYAALYRQKQPAPALGA
jgi:hypothetical protein